MQFFERRQLYSFLFDLHHRLHQYHNTPLYRYHLALFYATFSGLELEVRQIFQKLKPVA